jgi:hypothetical protein
MDQQLFQWVVGGVCLIGGVLLKTCWDAVKDLQIADRRLIERVSETEILVAGQYVRRDEIERLSTALFAKLDRIEIKIDGKQDKLP